MADSKTTGLPEIKKNTVPSRRWANLTFRSDGHGELYTDETYASEQEALDDWETDLKHCNLKWADDGKTHPASENKFCIQVLA